MKAAYFRATGVRGLRWADGYQHPAQLGPGPHAELTVHPGQVCFDGAQSHEQLGGDLWVGVTCGDQVGHALFGGGEDRPVSRWRGVCPQADEFVGDAPLPQRRAEPFEDCQRGLEQRQGLVLVPLPPVNLPGGKKRPCFLEGHREALLRLEPGFQRCLTVGEVTAGGEQQSPAPARGGNAPPPAQLGRPGLERAEQGLCRAKFAQPRERFDLVGKEAA